MHTLDPEESNCGVMLNKEFKRCSLKQSFDSDLGQRPMLRLILFKTRLKRLGYTAMCWG